MTLARWGAVLAVAAAIAALAVSLELPLRAALPVLGYQFDDLDDRVQYLAERDVERELEAADNNLKDINRQIKTAPVTVVPSLLKLRYFWEREIKRINRRLRRISK